MAGSRIVGDNMIVRITVQDMPIDLHVPSEQLDTVLRALTELTVKLWLIRQGRFQELQYYDTACTTPLLSLRQHYEDEALAAGVYGITVSNDDEQSSTGTRIEGESHE